jgi:hypothetical protein
MTHWQLTSRDIKHRPSKTYGRIDLSFLQLDPTACSNSECLAKGLFGRVGVTESSVSGDRAETRGFDGEEDALAEGLAVLDFCAEVGAVEEAGGLDCLTFVRIRTTREAGLLVIVSNSECGWETKGRMERD